MLKIFLERTESNERTRVEFVKREELEGKRAIKSDVMPKKITAIKEELSSRSE